ncbi:MAG: TetR/AcrR family transcriptional regulator [Methylacidiphilales bacterium]|nr:TetR/AcrR family transcriptional regulator [Candidatus Methylacidiphilales bacterium]
MNETSQKILEAAICVFARDGVAGATTREIARTARVNEVTLFRYFKNKNELLRRVVARCSESFEHVFAEASFETRADLRRTVLAYATIYMSVLHENEDFVRTFLGELNRHPKLCRSLFIESSKPARQKFIAYLQAAQKRRLVRRNLDVTTAADAFTGMLLAGVIRRPLTEAVYRNEDYVKTCLELFFKGIEA